MGLWVSFSPWSGSLGCNPNDRREWCPHLYPGSSERKRAGWGSTAQGLPSASSLETTALYVGCGRHSAPKLGHHVACIPSLPPACSSGQLSLPRVLLCTGVEVCSLLIHHVVLTQTAVTKTKTQRGKVTLSAFTWAAFAVTGAAVLFWTFIF